MSIDLKHVQTSLSQFKWPENKNTRMHQNAISSADSILSTHLPKAPDKAQVASEPRDRISIGKIIGGKRVEKIGGLWREGHQFFAGTT